MARGEEEEEFVDEDESEDADFAAEGDDDSEEEEEQGSEEEEAAAASTKSKKRGRKPAAADDKAKKKKKKGAQFFEEEADEVGGCRAWAAQAAHPARSLPPPAAAGPAATHMPSPSTTLAAGMTLLHTHYQAQHTAAVSPDSNSNESSGVQQGQTHTTTAVCACSCSRPGTSSCRPLAHVASGSTSCVSSSPTLPYTPSHRCSRACGFVVTGATLTFGLQLMPRSVCRAGVTHDGTSLCPFTKCLPACCAACFVLRALCRVLHAAVQEDEDEEEEGGSRRKKSRAGAHFFDDIAAVDDDEEEEEADVSDASDTAVCARCAVLQLVGVSNPKVWPRVPCIPVPLHSVLVAGLAAAVAVAGEQLVPAC